MFSTFLVKMKVSVFIIFFSGCIDIVLLVKAHWVLIRTFWLVHRTMPHFPNQSPSSLFFNSSVDFKSRFSELQGPPDCFFELTLSPYAYKTSSSFIFG